jgi:hypothetical protein
MYKKNTDIYLNKDVRISTKNKNIIQKNFLLWIYAQKSNSEVSFEMQNRKKLGECGILDGGKLAHI